MTAELPVYAVTGSAITLPVEPIVIDLFEAWASNPKWSDLTRKAYRGDWAPFFPFLAERYPGQPLDVLGVKRADVTAFLKQQKDSGLSNATVSRRAAALSSFYRYCVQEEVIQRNPCEFVERPEVDKAGRTPELVLADVRLLLAEAERDAGTGHLVGRSHALVALLAYLGLRAHEACRAAWEDLGASGGHRVLTVYGKGDTVTLMPVSAPLARALDGLPHRSGAFLRQGWAPEKALDTSSAAGIVARLGRAAGIEQHVTPHQIRVGAVTGLLRAGTSIDRTAILSRHRSLGTVQVYDRRRELDDHPAYELARLVNPASLQA